MIYHVPGLLLLHAIFALHVCVTIPVLIADLRIIVVGAFPFTTRSHVLPLWLPDCILVPLRGLTFDFTFVADFTRCALLLRLVAVVTALPSHARLRLRFVTAVTFVCHHLPRCTPPFAVHWVGCLRGYAFNVYSSPFTLVHAQPLVFTPHLPPGSGSAAPHARTRDTGSPLCGLPYPTLHHTAFCNHGSRFQTLAVYARYLVRYTAHVTAARILTYRLPARLTDTPVPGGAPPTPVALLRPRGSWFCLTVYRSGWIAGSVDIRHQLLLFPFTLHPHDVLLRLFVVR